MLLCSTINDNIAYNDSAVQQNLQHLLQELVMQSKSIHVKEYAASVLNMTDRKVGSKPA